MKITKQNIVKIPAEHQEGDVVAFQLIDFEINFFGAIQKFTLDSRILKDGSQYILNGNGWIKSGFKIA